MDNSDVQGNSTYIYIKNNLANKTIIIFHPTYKIWTLRTTGL